MTTQEKHDYYARWRRDHGIKPRAKKRIYRNPVRLAEMSPKKLQHIAISTKWIEAINEKLRR